MVGAPESSPVIRFGKFQLECGIPFFLVYSHSMTVDKSNAKVQEMFGQIAPNYDRMNHVLSMNVDHYWRWYTVRKLKRILASRYLIAARGRVILRFLFIKKRKGSRRSSRLTFARKCLRLAKKNKLGSGIKTRFNFKKQIRKICRSPLITFRLSPSHLAYGM